MTARRPAPITAGLAALVLCLSAVAPRAQPLPPLTPQDARDWAAVGVVNAAGASGLASCSGTLVTPDLVLTAAHCVAGDDAVPWARVFTLGGTGAAARLEMGVARIEVHPGYTTAATKIDRYGVDVAVMRLARPVPPDIAAPLPLSAEGQGPLSRVALVGYHRMRPGGVNGRFDCAVFAGLTPRQLRVACPVESGNSGGPVAVLTADGWRLIGVAVARLGADGALAAIADAWVRGQIAASDG